MVDGNNGKPFHKQAYGDNEIWVREQTDFPVLLEVLYLDVSTTERFASVAYVPYANSYVLRMNGKDLRPRACGFFTKEDAFEAAKVFAVTGLCGEQVSVC